MGAGSRRAVPRASSGGLGHLGTGNKGQNALKPISGAEAGVKGGRTSCIFLTRLCTSSHGADQKSFFERLEKKRKKRKAKHSHMQSS